MAAALNQLSAMALSPRVAEFRRVMASLEATGRAGAPIETEEAMSATVGLLEELRARSGRLYLVGNGGSAGIASHAVTDFLKFGKLRATTLHDPSLITCMSNDYGYEGAFERILAIVAAPNDLVIAVSSSGQSANIRNAAAAMRKLGGKVLTLSGFRRDNPLRSAGDLNFWLDSSDYGMVEIGHQFVLHNLADRIRLRGTE